MTTKPAKPRPDFPLYAHASGKWAKKIGGQLKYFGTWADPAEAERLYEAYVAAHRGQQPALKLGLTLENASNSFLDAKKKAVERGELAQRTWTEYRDTCQRFADHLGHERLVESLTPTDFASYRDWRSQSWNIVAVGNDVTRVRSLVKWLYESRLIRERPHFGPEFKRAGAKALRRHRREQGKKLFTAEHIHALLDEAGLQMRAMILLGINCGFGNTDCATLPLSALDLAGGWVRYPRPKTEIDRACPLWPETVAVLKDWVTHKRQPIDIVSVFVLPGGESWDNTGNPLAKRFRQLLLWAGIKRGGFYWLRHTFETIGGGAKDQVAVNAIMGHADASMAAVYREEIEDSRLLAVTEHVRKWLYG